MILISSRQSGKYTIRPISHKRNRSALLHLYYRCKSRLHRSSPHYRDLWCGHLIRPVVGPGLAFYKSAEIDQYDTCGRTLFLHTFLSSCWPCRLLRTFFRSLFFSTSFLWCRMQFLLGSGWSHWRLNWKFIFTVNHNWCHWKKGKKAACDSRQKLYDVSQNQTSDIQN